MGTVDVGAGAKRGEQARDRWLSKAARGSQAQEEMGGVLISETPYQFEAGTDISEIARKLGMACARQKRRD